MSNSAMLQSMEATLIKKKQEKEQQIQEQVNQITDTLMQTAESRLNQIADTIIQNAEKKLQILDKNYTSSLRTNSVTMQQITERVEHALQMIDTQNIRELKTTAKAIQNQAIAQMQKVGRKNSTLTAIISCTLTTLLMLVVYLLFIDPRHTKEIEEKEQEIAAMGVEHIKQIHELKDQIAELKAKLNKLGKKRSR
ncbi:hypothetical protein [Helicobacter bizzozeronii]|uniref:hypothetical protein n=1 Tax=Helicobacter bizzozeronii TaxID=56877 RepID=UPI001F285CE2|nr:hypothetical protein [Helicobacter bizzozeronii]